MQASLFGSVNPSTARVSLPHITLLDGPRPSTLPIIEAAAAATYAQASKGEAAQQLPKDWSKLAAGDRVLAADEPEDGWFFADVIEAVGDDKFRLRWRDWPELPSFTRRIIEIALLHPQFPGR